MSENYKEIVERANASFEENNLEGFLELCAEDVEWKMVGDKTSKGKDAIRQWMSSMGEMEPPKITNENQIVEGERVAAYGAMTMKNEKGETDSYGYCDIYRFKDGKIAELSSYVVQTNK